MTEPKVFYAVEPPLPEQVTYSAAPRPKRSQPTSQTVSPQPAAPLSVAAARNAIEQAKEVHEVTASRHRQLCDTASEIERDLAERKAELPGLAEDGEAFRAALAHISSEEDRLRALETVLLPRAQGDLEAATEGLNKAAGQLVRAEAVAALGEMFEADSAAAAALYCLEGALERCQDVRLKIIGAVCAEGSGIRPDATHIGVLKWAVPMKLRRFFHEPIGNQIGYRPDIVAWHRERIGLASAEGSK